MPSFIRLLGVVALLCTSTCLLHANPIVISEIHYNPADVGGLDGDLFEFIEFKNISSSAVDLSGYSLLEGVDYIFPAGTTLGAGEYYVIGRSNLYFQSRYGVYPDDEYSPTKLSNSGEDIILINTTGDIICSVSYQDGGGWPVLADGYGFSLVLKDENGDIDDKDNWRNSSVLHGSPGEADSGNDILPVYINEVYSNSTGGAVDSIELYNPNAETVDISGWGMSDKGDKPFLFTIPSGTSIDAGEYITFSQGVRINADSVAVKDLMHFGFGLSSTGDEVSLYSAHNESLTGYIHSVKFNASKPDLSFSRFVNAEGREIFEPSELTFSAENMHKPAGPLVFENILYAPLKGQYEFLKVKNISDDLVNIDYWDFSGIGFEKDSLFADIAAGESFYLVDDTIAPAEFIKTLGLPENTQVFTYRGSLKNEGESIEILEPGDTIFDGLDTIVPYYIVEKIRYNDKSPWPEKAADGYTLVRSDFTVWANDPYNWTADIIFNGPSAAISGESQVEPGTIVTLSAGLSTDPNGESLSYKWAIQKPGETEFTVINDTSSSIDVLVEMEGTHKVKLVVTNASGQGSFPAFLDISSLIESSLHGNNAQEIAIYPSITNGIIHIETGSNIFDRYDIFTIFGSPVLKGNLTASESVVDLNSIKLNAGYYIVQLSSETAVYVQKVFYKAPY